MANWVVGHVGSSDWNHRYWPLLYQIALTENEQVATEMFQYAINVIEEDSKGDIDDLLVDGGTALEATAKMLPL